MSAPLDHRRMTDVDVLIRDGDAARTIVLLHGIGGRAESFAELMRRWPAGPRLVAWDMPGYGESKRFSRGGWTNATNHSAVLVSLIAELGASRVDIVGQSLGGLIAAYAAAVFPEFRVHRRLVLLSPALGYSAPPVDPLPPALVQRVADFRAEGAAAFAAKRAPRLVFDAANRPEIVEKVRASMASLSDDGHTDAVQVLAGGDLLALAPHIPGRVLLLSGIEDVVTPTAGTRGLLAEFAKRQRAPDVSEQLIEIPSAGHAAYLERPDDVIGSIATFLEAP